MRLLLLGRRHLRAVEVDDDRRLRRRLRLPLRRLRWPPRRRGQLLNAAFAAVVLRWRSTRRAPRGPASRPAVGEVPRVDAVEQPGRRTWRPQGPGRRTRRGTAVAGMSSARGCPEPPGIRPPYALVTGRVAARPAACWPSAGDPVIVHGAGRVLDEGQRSDWSGCSDGLDVVVDRLRGRLRVEPGLLQVRDELRPVALGGGRLGAVVEDRVVRLSTSVLVVGGLRARRPSSCRDEIGLEVSAPW